MSVMECLKCSARIESRDHLAMHMLEHSFTTDEEITASRLPKTKTTNKQNSGMRRQVSESKIHQMLDMRDESRCEVCHKVI